MTIRKLTDAPNIAMRPLTPADAKARASLRAFLAPHKGERHSIAAGRAAFDAIMLQTPAAEDIAYAADTIGGVPGIWCRPSKPTSRTVLYLHGGWFVSGSPEAYRNFVGQIAARASAPVFIAGYRLAPEHPFPAAIEDARAAFDGLVDRGLRDIVIAGDSAGGALALELLAGIVRDAPEVRPTGAVLLSPVTDLSQSGVTWESRDAADLLFTKQQVRELIDQYVGDADPALPFSSVKQDFTGFPPMRIHVGDDEVLLDDSLRLAERAGNAGVDVRLDVWEGMLHVFPSGFATFEAANLALDEVTAFIRYGQTMSEPSQDFDPEAFVRNAYAIAERMDLGAWKALFAEDGVFIDESIKITYKGPAEWDHPLKKYHTAFADMHRELYDVWSVGNTVFVRLALQGTQTGPLETPSGTIPPTGKRMDAPCADIWELENGKIKKFDCYPEGSVILTQLGVIENLEAAIRR
jgi:acetyl esterase/lipase/ketosteroid isomerase-like protein